MKSTTILPKVTRSILMLVPFLVASAWLAGCPRYQCKGRAVINCPRVWGFCELEPFFNKCGGCPDRMGRQKPDDKWRYCIDTRTGAQVSEDKCNPRCSESDCARMLYHAQTECLGMAADECPNTNCNYPNPRLE
jgi:hypothetical protein